MLTEKNNEINKIDADASVQASEQEMDEIYLLRKLGLTFTSISKRVFRSEEEIKNILHTRRRLGISKPMKWKCRTEIPKPHSEDIQQQQVRTI